MTVQTFYILWFKSMDLQDTICVEKTTTEIPTVFNLSKSESLLLHIIILTAPKNTIQREAIRETWVKTVDKYDSIEYSFAMGNKNVSSSDMDLILKEREKYVDIWILDGVEEIYTRLSRKALKAFTCAYRHTDAQYYMKTDDDSYVVVDSLYKVLTEEDKSIEKMVLGSIHHLGLPHKGGKWAEFGWFLCKNYFDFPVGAGYIITRDIVKHLSHNSDRLMHYNNEDTSLGSWIASLRHTFVHDSRIAVLKNDCKTTNWLMHYITPANLKDIHSKWVNSRRFC